MAVLPGGPSGTFRDVARHVRSQSLLAAKAHGRMALDSVYLDIKDLDGLRAEVDDAVTVGFDVKVAIHPGQVSVIRAGYAPLPDQVQWARHVLAAASDERGVFAFGGIMVDAPVLRRAERSCNSPPTQPSTPAPTRVCSDPSRTGAALEGAVWLEFPRYR